MNTSIRDLLGLQFTSHSLTKGKLRENSLSQREKRERDAVRANNQRSLRGVNKGIIKE